MVTLEDQIEMRHALYEVMKRFTASLIFIHVVYDVHMSGARAVIKHARRKP